MVSEAGASYPPAKQHLVPWERAVRQKCGFLLQHAGDVGHRPPRITRGDRIVDESGACGWSARNTKSSVIDGSGFRKSCCAPGAKLSRLPRRMLLRQGSKADIALLPFGRTYRRHMGRLHSLNRPAPTVLCAALMSALCSSLRWDLRCAPNSVLTGPRTQCRPAGPLCFCAPNYQSSQESQASGVVQYLRHGASWCLGGQKRASPFVVTCIIVPFRDWARKEVVWTDLAVASHTDLFCVPAVLRDPQIHCDSVDSASARRCCLPTGSA